MIGRTPVVVWVIPHTHWDREWYEPHDVFRARLVAMMDDLLDVLQGEPEYKFTLDGQSAALDDYLEIRPERLDQVRAVVGRGQLAVGPFQILLDEFCCDGETIVRNLEHGLRSAGRVGAAMRVGYLPDMFGHAAQMPQILRGFDIRDASLWRGVPASVDQHGFVWEALDGSQVRVEYLWDGYGNALKLFEPLAKLPGGISDYVRDNASWFGGEEVAGMFGTDHMAPRADLMEILRSYRAEGHDIALKVATVEEVIASRDHSSEALQRLPQVRGELRSHARGNLLPGVFSIRTNIKAAMARAERALATAERFDAWVGGGSRTAFLERGWGLVVESTAHDSVTGCGADATADEVESRLLVAAHTARGAIDIGLGSLAATAVVGEVAVFNQSGWARDVQTELVVELASTEAPGGVQVLEELGTIIGDETMKTSDLPRVVRRIHGQELFGKLIRAWTWGDDALEFEVADYTNGDFDVAVFNAELSRRMAGAEQSDLWRVVTRMPQSCRVLVGGRADGLSAVAVGVDRAVTPEAPVRAEGRTLDNSLVAATVGGDGAVMIEDHTSGVVIRSALRLVDEGDRGDSYNFGPVSGGAISEPSSVEVEVLEVGPLRGRLRIRRTYELPVSLREGDRASRSDDNVAQVVDTVLELRLGEPFLRVNVSMVNHVRDHRLRILVPVGASEVAESSSAGQYGVTTRGRRAEGGWGEFPLPTFPATRFVHTGRVGVLLDKLVEYEVLDGSEGDDVIALTILRAVGMMSVNVHPLRDEPAGSEVPTPGAQYIGTHVDLSFAVDLSAPEGVSNSGIVEHSDLFRFEPVVAPGRGTGPGVGASAQVQTRGRVALESLRRVDGTLEARFVNYSTAPEPLRAVAAGTWRRTDLTGNVLVPDIDVWELVVGAGEIITLRGVR